MRLHILCEGQTEETFVRDVITPYFATKEIWIEYSVFKTSPKQKGGIVSYEKTKRQIINQCKQDRKCQVTTLIDYYGLPTNFPKLTELEADIKTAPHQNIAMLEQAFAADINQPNFIANFMLHEFEAYLFTNTCEFKLWFEDQQVAELAAVRQQFSTPEHINNSKHTAPSKRILSILPHYKKQLHGPQIAELITIDTIRQQCPHFNQWLARITALGHK